MNDKLRAFSGNGPSALPLDLGDELIEVAPGEGATLVLRARTAPSVGHEKGPLLRALTRALSRAGALRSCNAVVISGGLPLFDWDSAHLEEEAVHDAVLACGVPVVAALREGARGGGWLLALLCDEAVYAEEGAYQMDAVPSERIPEGGATFAFPHRLGEYLGQEALLSGRPYSAKELLERGAALRAVPRAQVEELAVARARALSAEAEGGMRERRAEVVRELLERVRRARSAERGAAAQVEASGVPGRFERAGSAGRENGRVEIGSRVVDLEIDADGVASVTLHDRESKNTFSEALVRGLSGAFAYLRSDHAVKVVVLKGYDTYFACGGTKDALLAIQSGSAKFTDIGVQHLPLASEVPVIAAMQGHGIGAGWAMGMFCDVVVLSAESNYASPYMRYGFTPGAGATLIFPHRFGSAFGSEILFSAKEYKGHELRARRIGMPVLPRGQVEGHATELARRMARAPREVLVRLKGLLSESLREKVGGTYEQELAMHEQTFVGSVEVKKRIQASFDEGLPAAGRACSPGAAAADASAEDLSEVRETLRRALAEELSLEIEDVVTDKLFVDLGLDSITGVTWIRKVNKRYALTISATTVYDHPTIDRFAGYVLEERAKLAPIEPPGEEAQPSRGAGEREDGRREPPPVQEALFSPRESSAVEAVSNGGALPPSASSALRPERSARPAPSALCDVAVIGMSGRFPNAPTIGAFWDNIAGGRDCISEVPPTRWSTEHYYDSNPRAPGKTYSKWMGVLEGVEEFDAPFFNISPLEAKWTDPQQRLFLQACWHCIEDAGYRPGELSGSLCGVFVGCATGDYGSALSADGLTGHAIIGNSCSILASRISYFLDLRGPSLAIDTACSSSLVAVASACDALLLGNVDLALAGGVNVLTTPGMHIMTSKAGMLSRGGRCYTFDQRADGFVPGEGVGVVLLKRLDDALRDKDPIYGVIRGWGVNQDGKTNGITAPSAEAQRRLEKKVYERFSIDPGEIQLVEAHGTGTKLGDPIEIEALTSAFREHTARTGYCAVGSVKSNIGHLLTAAGIAGLIKVLLALWHRKLPPTIHYRERNEHVRLEGGPFYVSTECRAWDVPEDVRRRAAVSSFGFSGTNVHVVVEEWLPEDNPERVATVVAELIVLSAKNEGRLKAAAGELQQFIVSHRDFVARNLSDIAHTLQMGRQPMEERLAFTVRSASELEEKLAAYLSDETRGAGSFRGRVGEWRDAELFEDDEGMLRVIDGWMHSGKLAKLARLWAHGMNVDWSALPASKERRRVRLPGYPFEKSRYWLPDTAAEKAGAARSQHAEGAKAAPSAQVNGSSRENGAAGVLAKPANVVLRDCGPADSEPRAAPARPPERPGVDRRGGVLRLTAAARAASPLEHRRAIEELSRRLGEIRNRPDVKVVLVDIKGAASRRATGTADEWAAGVDLAGEIVKSEVPVIAAISGDVGPEELLLASACDVMVCSEDAAFVGRDIERNAIPDRWDRAFSFERFGAASGQHLLYSPEAFTGRDARRTGIRVCPAAEVDQDGLRTAEGLAELPRQSLFELRQALNESFAHRVRDLRARPRGLSSDESARAGAAAPVSMARDGVLLEGDANGVVTMRLLGAAEPGAAMQSLAAAFELISGRRHHKVVVILDEGSEIFRDAGTQGEASWEAVRDAVARCEVPTIAAMAGGARGLGWAFGLLCDSAIHAEESAYQMPLLKQGRAGADWVCASFPHRLGRYLGREALLAGCAYTGAELKARSPATVVPRAAVASHATALARSWAALSASEARRLKDEMWQGLADATREVGRGDGDPVEDGSERRREGAPAGEETRPTLRRVAVASEVVTVEMSDRGVVLVTMCDRTTKNAFSEAMVQGLAAAFDFVDRAPECKVVVLTGYEQYFSSGGSKEGLMAIQRGVLKYSDVPIYDLALKCRVPVIAGVQGHAMGAGWTLAMFCDIILMSEESVYCSSFMQYGFTPGAGSTLVFPQQLGHDLGRELLITAKRYKGYDLAARGIGMRVMPRSRVVDSALELAHEMAAAPRSALVRLKEHLARDLRSRLETTYARELSMQEKTFVGSEEVRRRIEAYFDAGIADEEPRLLRGDEPQRIEARVAPGTADEERRPLWRDAPRGPVDPGSGVPSGAAGSGREAAAETSDGIRRALRESFARELHMEVDAVGEDSRFTDMGLDSITGVTWIQEINRQYNVYITIKQVHEYPTIRELGAYVYGAFRPSGALDPAGAGTVQPPEHHAAAGGDASLGVLIEDHEPRPSARAKSLAARFPELVQLNDVVRGRPIFWIHAGLGGVEGYQGVARRLERPFYGIQARGWMTDREPLRGIPAMAAYYVQAIQALQPEGPYDLGGYSIGGMLAYEVTRQTQDLGHAVESLVMVDTLDTMGIRGVDLTRRSELLQVTNILLGAGQGRSYGQLIHRREVPPGLEGPELVDQLIALARAKGLTRSEAEARAIILKMVAIQQAYEAERFSIAPLKRPSEVRCVYFRNKSGVFLGDLADYYSLGGDRMPLADCYWSEWSTALTDFRVVDVTCSNHMTLLVEPAACEAVVEHCVALYSRRQQARAVLTEKAQEI